MLIADRMMVIWWCGHLCCSWLPASKLRAHPVDGGEVDANPRHRSDHQIYDIDVCIWSWSGQSWRWCRPADRWPKPSPESGDIFSPDDGLCDPKHWWGAQSAPNLQIGNVRLWEGTFKRGGMTCCLVFTRSRGWKRRVEQVPLRRQLYIIHNFKQHVSEIVSFVSNTHISFTILQIIRHSGNFTVCSHRCTWGSPPERPLSLDSTGTPPPSPPVFFLPLVTVFLLSYSCICTSFNFCLTNSWLKTCVSMCWSWRSRSPGISAFWETQNQVQVQVAGSSVLPGGPAVHIVELSDGGQLPPGEVVDPDGHFRSSRGSWLSVGHPRHNLVIRLISNRS